MLHSEREPAVTARASSPAWVIPTLRGLASSATEVLVCRAHDPGVRLRDIVTTLDITERSAYSIVTDLTASGFVVKAKDGPRNRCQIESHLPLREAITRQPGHTREGAFCEVGSSFHCGGAAPERRALTDGWARSGCRRDTGSRGAERPVPAIQWR